MVKSQFVMEFVKKILIDKSKNTYVQFFRYGFVATVSLAVDFGLLVYLKEVDKVNYLLAATISFTFGLITNYLLSVLWVFHSSKLVSKKHEVLIFGLIGLVGLGITDLILWVLTSGFGVYYVLSKIVATSIVYFWNFGARKKYIFN